jgi:hypothetical protein
VFEVVDRHIQHRSGQADEDIIKNKQAVAPASVFGISIILIGLGLIANGLDDLPQRTC